MNKRSFLLLLAVLGLWVQAFAYRTVTVNYQSGYAMDCYIPSSFTGCPNPNDADPDFYPCGASNVTIMVIMHGGFFQTGSRSSMTPYALGFAALENMIVLNIDYRKGWGFNSSTPCNGNNIALQKATYRVVQDAHKAINYFIDHAGDPGFDIANSEKYTWNVFAGGYSAGGVTALNMHATQAEWDNDYPYISPVEGNITRTPGSFRYLGCFAIGGGAANMAYLKGGTYNVLFHSSADPIMPYTYGFPINQACSTYTPVNGGYNIFNYIDANANATCKLYTKVAGGHGAFASTQADVQFVVNKFISSSSAACYFTSCGMIPGPPFWAGINCPQLMPSDGDVPFMPLPQGVTEYATAYYWCPVPQRIVQQTVAPVLTTLQGFMNSAGQKQVKAYGTDGRLLFDGQANSMAELTSLLNERFAKGVLILEVTNDVGEVNHFNYLQVE